MLEISNVEVFGWNAAIRGMRNPKNSWNLSDTDFDDGKPCLGENDTKLMQNLRKAGSDHRKYLRMIVVQMDILAPLYWWKEFDTYKVGTVANSCSTMHKIHAKEFTIDDFSHEHLDNKMVLGLEANGERRDNDMSITAKSAIEVIVSLLNAYRNEYIKTQDKHWWWQMIQLLPTSYNQKRTVQINYETLLNIYNSRAGHKLNEWQTLREFIETLPYFKMICIDESKEHTCNCGGTCGGNCKCGGHNEE